MGEILGVAFLFAFSYALLSLSFDVIKLNQKRSQLCQESNCCYDDAWDAVVCKDWEKQIKW